MRWNMPFKCWERISRHSLKKLPPPICCKQLLYRDSNFTVLCSLLSTTYYASCYYFFSAQLYLYLGYYLNLGLRDGGLLSFLFSFWDSRLSEGQWWEAGGFRMGTRDQRGHEWWWNRIPTSQWTQGVHWMSQRGLGLWNRAHPILGLLAATLVVPVVASTSHSTAT